MGSEVSGTVKDIISNILNVDKDQIDDAFSPNHVDNWDSLNHIKIIILLEEKFGIKFEADKITEMVDFKKICSTVTETL